MNNETIVFIVSDRIVAARLSCAVVIVPDRGETFAGIGLVERRRRSPEIYGDKLKCWLRARINTCFQRNDPAQSQEGEATRGFSLLHDPTLEPARAR